MSFLLLGARGTGKTWLRKQQVKDIEPHYEQVIFDVYSLILFNIHIQQTPGDSGVSATDRDKKVTMGFIGDFRGAGEEFGQALGISKFLPIPKKEF